MFDSQVHLHYQKDIPMIQDLGFAVGPGAHALIAVKVSNVSNQHNFLKVLLLQSCGGKTCLYLFQSTSLGHPYDTCAEKDLAYFQGDDYTFSKCQHECTTDKLIHSCHCKDAYMPGNNVKVLKVKLCHLLHV